MKSKIKNIEFLRVLLIICILLFHLFQKVNLGTYFPDFCITSHFADKAVEMFFIISGFLLLYTFNEKTSVFEFLTKKIIRFLPLMLFLGFCYYIFSVVTHSSFKKYEFIYDLLFLNNIGITLSTSNILGSWFISVLVFVSLFYFYLLKSLKRQHANLIIAFCTYISFVLLVNLTNGTLGGHVKIYNNFFNAGMLRGLSCIGLGYFICQIYIFFTPLIQKQKNSCKNFIICSIIEIFLFIFTFNNLLFHNMSFNNKTILLISFSCLFLMLLINNGIVSKLAELEVFSKMSKYSLSIYLSHLFIYKIMKYFLWNFDLNKSVSAMITITAAVTFSVIIYHFIELPAIKFLQRKILKPVQTLSVNSNIYIYMEEKNKNIPN